MYVLRTAMNCSRPQRDEYDAGDRRQQLFFFTQEIVPRLS